MTLHGGTRGDKRTYVFPKQSSALTLPLEAVKTGPNFTTELIALHTLSPTSERAPRNQTSQARDYALARNQ
jgi:hypothetical protein